MVEAVGTLQLLDSLSTPRPVADLLELLKEPQLARMFPSLGVPAEIGVRSLVTVSRGEGATSGNEIEKALVGYFAELRGARHRIEEWIEEFRGEESHLRTAAFGRTQGWLPEGAGSGPVRFVVLPLGLDFRTDRATVYLDPLAGLQYGRGGLIATLAHELHHVARCRLTGENPTLMRPPEEPAVRSLGGTFREWARWLELEGIADCVSNVTQTESPAFREAGVRRRTEMDRYEELLADALGKFRGMNLSEPHRVNDLAVLRRGLRSIAHPAGTRIAQTIQERSGRHALVECVGAPGRFLERFDQLVRQTGDRGFPSELLGCLLRGRRPGMRARTAE